MIRPEDCPIVVFGDDWGRHVSSMQHTFREIVPQRKVIWVNGIGHRIPGLRAEDIRRAWEKGLAILRSRRAPARNGAWDGPAPEAIIHPRVLPWHNRSAVLAFNQWSLVRSIREELRKVQINAPPVIVTGSPPSAPVLGRLGEVASVYFCMDDFAHLAGVSANMLETLERRLLGVVDAMVATAESLTDTKAPRSGEAHYLPQGVNYEHFAEPRPEPEDLRGLPRPLLGFAGGISACCDLNLIRRLADENADGSVVLVGPVVVDTAPLDRPNIHILGPRPYSDLPAYVQRFDVGLIPYVLNDWTRAVDPLKLLEYLAAGVPVVSMSIPEVLKYSEWIGIGDSHESFSREVSRSLKLGGEVERTARQKVASHNTWGARAARLLEIVDDIVERRTTHLTAAES